MLLTKLLGIVLVGISVALITQTEASASNQLVYDATKAIALYSYTQANIISNGFLNIEKALNSSYEYVDTLLESLPQRLSVDSALSAVAALEEKAKNLGVDISICITANFEKLHLYRILALTYSIRDSYTTYVQALNKGFLDACAAYAPSSRRYSIDDCVEMEFGENACLMQLLTVVQIDLSTLEALANTPLVDSVEFSTVVNSQLTTVVEDDANSFNSSVQDRLNIITQCAENIFNLRK